MVRPYKNPKDRKLVVPISVPASVISDFEVAAVELDKNRSELMTILIVNFLENKKNKKFMKELIK